MILEMDKFEKLELLEEFLVRWNGGRSLGTITKNLISEGYNRTDVETCGKIFDKWSATKKPWSVIKKIRA